MLQLAQRHGDAGVGRPALQAAPGARDRGRASRASASRWPSTRSTPLPFKPEHVELITQRDARRDAGRHVGALVRRRAVQDRRQDRHRAGGRRSRPNEKYNASKIDEHQRDHSLYIAFAPLEEPTRRAGAGRRERRLRRRRRGADRAPRVRLPAARRSTRARRTSPLTQQGKSAAPIGTPRAVDAVPLPGRRGRRRRRPRAPTVRRRMRAARPLRQALAPPGRTARRASGRR